MNSMDNLKGFKKRTSCMLFGTFLNIKRYGDQTKPTINSFYFTRYLIKFSSPKKRFKILRFIKENLRKK
ncbi:hypothetical protein BpHYR1_043725 [Brachionus plicatilis]|uniref:Uncharacterized protein n=1 Tax=Brachionus plicatilis TaxID=10195 RepID=A0A3M7PPR8_BRAPC|nr:hypothetical protein BpHYR1_043725 [Brachionus plicatilis]